MSATTVREAEPAEGEVVRVLVSLLDGIRRARSVTEVNLAAGAARLELLDLYRVEDRESDVLPVRQGELLEFSSEGADHGVNHLGQLLELPLNTE